MPSGKTHDKITLYTTPIVGGLTFLLTKNIDTTLLMTTTYFISGLMFSGDLDIKSKQVNRWGVLGFIWTPYRKLFKHRSAWTHGPIKGTIVRLLYLFVWYLMFATLLFMYKEKTVVDKEFFIHTFESIKGHVLDYPQFYMTLFIGLCLGAFSHTIADVVSTKYKRFKLKTIKKLNQKNRHKRKRR